MAGSNNFYLRSNNFDNNVKTYWQQLQRENDLCDITLACENKQIKTHKAIISSCSPVLRNIVKLHQNKHALIYLRKVKFTDLQNLLNFMYQGEVNVDEEDLSSFLEVAKDLNIKGLSAGNIEGCDSNKESSSQFLNQSFVQSLERHRTSENEIMDTETEIEKMFIEADEIFFNDDSKNYGFSESAGARYQVKASVKSENDCIAEAMVVQQFSCRKCEEKFSNQTALSRHTGKVHKGIQYSCDKCDLKTTEKYDLKRHIELVHERVAGREVSCRKCEEQFLNQTALSRHIRKIHKGIQYSCDKCDFKATDKYDVKRHIESVHERVVGREVSCRKCEEQFLNQTALSRHNKKVHRGIQYSCDRCDLKAVDKCDLKRHIESAHEGVCYPCILCEYKAKWKAGLKRHMLKFHN